MSTVASVPPSPSGPQVTILSTAHPAGDGRIRRWVEGFVAAGARVHVVALHSSAHSSPYGDSATLQALSPAGRKERLRRSLTLPFTQHSDLIVAIDPELFVPALILKRARRCRVIADVHEDFASLATDHDRWGPRLSRALIANGARLAVNAAAQCDATVVADAHLPPLRARRRVVGRNLADPADFEVESFDAMSDTARHTGPLRAVYAGDLTPQRGLDAMLDGVVASPATTLDLFGPDRQWARAAIERAESESAGRIRYRGLLPHSELVVELPSYQVGLSLLHRIPSYDAAMPSKIYEYQAAGLATITSNLPRCADAVRDTNGGTIIGGSVERWAGHLTTALNDYGADAQLLAAQRRNARRAAIARAGDSDSLAAAVRSLTDLLD